MRRTARSVGICSVAVVIGAAFAQASGAREEPGSPAEPSPIEAGAAAEAPRTAAKAAAPPVLDDPAKAKKLDALLEEWERRNAEISQLDASFRRIDRKRGEKVVTAFEGRALMKGPGLSCVNIDKLIRNVNPEAAAVKVFSERVIRTVDGAVKYDGVGRRIEFYLGNMPQREGAPGRGPLPFLLGVKAGELRSNYQIKLLEEGRDGSRIELRPLAGLGLDGPGRAARFLLGLLPWGGVDGEFSGAVVDVNRETWLPDAMMIESPDGGETQTYVFKEIKANVTVADENFRVRNISGWAVVRPPAFVPRAQVAAAARRTGDPEQAARPAVGQGRPR